jgi:hypothetical protein
MDALSSFHDQPDTPCHPESGITHLVAGIFHAAAAQTQR